MYGPSPSALNKIVCEGLDMVQGGMMEFGLGGGGGDGEKRGWV